MTKRSDLTLYQQGAITYLELTKKAKKIPSFAGFLDPKIFAMSFGWFQIKKKRGYSEEDAAQFLAGFAAARVVKAAEQ